MTGNEADKLCGMLEKAGYKRFDNCLSSTEDFGYFKSFGDRDSQIEYRFWDFSKFLFEERERFGVDVIVLGSSDKDSIRNFIMTDRKSEIFNISNIERIADAFDKFCISIETNRNEIQHTE